MNDLRKAAEQALEALEDIWGCLPTKKAWPQDEVAEAVKALQVTLAKPEWVGLTDEDLSVCDEDGVLLARYWEAKLKEKNT